MTGEKDMALAPQPVNDPGLLMIERMVADPLVDADKLEKLMNLRDREFARLAEQAFNGAMSSAQTEMRPVEADATNPQTRSKYASYAALDRAVRPIYTRHGFGLSFDTVDGAPANFVRIVCYVTHAAGHSRTYRADMPADGKGAKGGDVMTLTHAAGAAMSYGMRYLLKMIFNIAVGEDDRDGNQVREEVKAPEGFEGWYDDMDAMVVGGCTWKEFAAAWNPEPMAKFRAHLAKHNPGKIDEWKRKAKAVKESK